MRAGLFLALLTFASCSARGPAELPPPPSIAPTSNELAPAGPQFVSYRSYIDVRPGWRLRTITPWLEDGGYQVSVDTSTTEGDTVTVSAGDNLIGYETAYYEVKPVGIGGARIKLSSAQVAKDGETTDARHPQPWRLQLPRKARFFRLIYLRRLSDADHNMALVASADRGTLEELTDAVQRNPDEACVTKRDQSCLWIPPGIGLRPERPKPGTDPVEWVPAP